MILSLLQVPFALQALGTEAFGLWMTLTSTVTLLMFSDLGLSNGVQNRIAIAKAHDDDQGIRLSYATGIASLSAIGIVVFLLFLLILPFFHWADIFGVRNSDLRQWAAPGLTLAVAVFCLGMPMTVVLKALQGLQKAWLLGFVNLGASALTLVAVMVCAWMHAHFLVFVVATALPIPLSNLALTLWSYRFLPSLRFHYRDISKEELRELAALGGQFLVPQIGATVLLAAPQVIISNALGAAAVTPFNLCQRIFTIFQQAQGLALMPLWSAYTEAKELNDYRWVRNAFLTSWVLSAISAAVFCSACVFFGPHFFTIWVGSSSKLLPQSLINAYALWTFISSVGIPYAYLLNGLGRLKGVLIYGSINTIITLLGMLVVVHSWGAPGILGWMCVSFSIVILPAMTLDSYYAFLHLRSNAR